MAYDPERPWYGYNQTQGQNGPPGDVTNDPTSAVAHFIARLFHGASDFARKQAVQATQGGTEQPQHMANLSDEGNWNAFRDWKEEFPGAHSSPAPTEHHFLAALRHALVAATGADAFAEGGRRYIGAVKRANSNKKLKGNVIQGHISPQDVYWLAAHQQAMNAPHGLQYDGPGGYTRDIYDLMGRPTVSQYNAHDLPSHRILPGVNDIATLQAIARQRAPQNGPPGWRNQFQ